MVAVALSGCMTSGHQHGAKSNGCSSCTTRAAAAPGVQGPWGQPMLMTGAPGKHSQDKAPWAQGRDQAMIHAGGMMPGMNGGVVQASHHPAQGGAPAPTPPYGAVAATGAMTPGMHPGMMPRRTEVRFLGPDGTRVRWMTGNTPSPQSLTVPGRYNFLQAAIYRLKLDIPREDLTALYPTLEVVPGNARTEAFLAHSAVPVAFTNEDFDQVKAGNYVVKVVYLPDPQFQDLATAGPEEIVSTRLEPGADPIAEAHRRGSVLLVVRFGNIDLELPHSPPIVSRPPMNGTGPSVAVPADAGMPMTRRGNAGGIQQVGHQKTPTTPGSDTKAKSNSSKSWWNFGK